MERKVSYYSASSLWLSPIGLTTFKGNGSLPYSSSGNSILSLSKIMINCIDG